MADNPVILLIRFWLEIVGLFGLGHWGWAQHTAMTRIMYLSYHGEISIGPKPAALDAMMGERDTESHVISLST